MMIYDIYIYMEQINTNMIQPTSSSGTQVIAPTLAWDVKAAMDLAQKQALHVAWRQCGKVNLEEFLAIYVGFASRYPR